MRDIVDTTAFDVWNGAEGKSFSGEAILNKVLLGAVTEELDNGNKKKNALQKAVGGFSSMFRGRK